MNISNQVDFETFYFHSLLESIKSNAGDKFEGAMQKNLNRFIDFLSSGDSPLDSIEKLASLQGTSDVSIFFSDLIERISDFPPETALEKINEYTSDFLEIFRELASEPSFEHNVIQELIGIEPVEDDKYDVFSFVKKQVRNQILENFTGLDESIEKLVNCLLNRLDSEDELLSLSGKYKDNEHVQDVIFLLQNLYRPPREKVLMEGYMSEFFSNVKDLSRELKQIYSEKPEVFEEFCQGEAIVGQFTETDEMIEKKVTEIDDTVQKLEEHEASMPEVVLEDQNLRVLLRGYIVNEIEDLTNEVVQSLNKLAASPANENLRIIILDDLKAVKDLGQIHKYPAIEEFSGHILEKLRLHFQGGKVVDVSSIDLLKKLFSEYISYIDQTLDNQEEQGRSVLKDLEELFLSSLETAEPLEAKFTFQNSQVVKDAFTNTHSRFLKRIRNNYAIFVDTKSEESQEGLSSDLLHLINWYALWQLSGPNHVLEIVHNWLKNLEKHDKLAGRQEVIYAAFSKLSDRLFTAMPDEWTELVEKLALSKGEEQAVDISKSLEAFKEVTQKHITLIIDALVDKKLQYATVLSDYQSPNLYQIIQNSALAKEQSVQDLAQYISDHTAKIKDIPEGRENSFREGIADIFKEFSRGVENLPAEFSVNEIKEKFGNLIGQVFETKLPLEEETVGKESAVPSREEFIDEELKDIFRDEATKYLDEIEKHIEKLTTDFKNEKELKKLSNVIHTLRGSAKMVNRSDVAELVGPIEELSELVLQKRVKLRKQFLSLCKRMLKAVRRSLEDKKVHPKKLISSIDNYISKYQIEEEKKAEIESSTDQNHVEVQEEEAERNELTESEPAPLEEVEEVPSGQEALLKLSEKDPELLEIFKNEASENLNNIERDLTLIEKFQHDKKTLQSLDHSVHEIRSAAKMLGFSEIGVLFDDLEQLIEQINKKEPEDWKTMIPTLRKSVQIIRDLTENKQVPLSMYDETTQAVSLFLEKLRGDEVPRPLVETKQHPSPKVSEETELSETVINSFIQEAREYLEDINFLLMKMEKNPGDQDLAQRLMRTLHTLKGSAAMVYLEAPEKLAHLSEDVLETFLQKPDPLPQNLYDLFFDMVDEVDFVISALVDGNRDRTKNFDRIVKELQKLISDNKGEEPSHPEELEPKPPETLESKENFLSITDETDFKKVKPRDTYIRLHVNQMDSLLNESAELVINHTQLKKQVDKLKGDLPRMDMEGKNLQNILWYLEEFIKEEQQLVEQIEPLTKDAPSLHESQQKQIGNIQNTINNLKKFSQNFSQILQNIKDSGKLYEDQIHKILRLSNQIHESIMNARLVPVEILFQRFQRPLRDLARKYNKKVKLAIKGEETELDRTLIEELYEPLLHLLRNAIDHGIELPKDRKKLGKSEEGVVKLSAERERNFVTFTVEDDGQGIDVDKVKKRAIEMGFLKEDQAKMLTDQEVFEYMMYSGFSTSTVKTELSGRGMGLDIVRNQIQKIKGDIRIYSEQGTGTKFLVRVPISLTVTQAMLVEVEQNIYAIPLLQVEETMDLDKKDLIIHNDDYHMNFGGKQIPIIKLSSLLKINEEKTEPAILADTYPIIIVQDEGNKVALLVDKILHREEILIKSLGNGLQGIRFISGGSILADGRVVLVLDVRQLVFIGLRRHINDAVLKSGDVTGQKVMETQVKKTRPEPSRVKRVVKGRKPKVLVADDSLSIRKFLSGLLSKKDYEVEVAKNGYNALELLNQMDFDLIISDLEMPHLSGYELIEQIRGEAKWDELPVFVLTGRASQHIQQLSMKLGADEFIIKPFKEEDLLKKIENYIEYKK